MVEIDPGSSIAISLGDTFLLIIGVCMLAVLAGAVWHIIFRGGP